MRRAVATSTLFSTCVLAACGGGGGANPDATSITCGPGTYADGSVCVLASGDGSTPLPCGTGTHAVGNLCVTDEPTILPDGGFPDPTSWSAAVDATPQSVDVAAEPTLAVQADGTIFAAFMGAAHDHPGSWGVYLVRSNDHGRMFTLVESHSPTTPGEFLGDVSLAVDRSGRVFWAYIDYHESSNATIVSSLLVEQSPDGTSFGAAQTVSASGVANAFNDRPWLSLAPDGTMYVSWTSGPTSSEAAGSIGSQYATSVNGAPFSTPVTILDAQTAGGTLIESPLGFDANGSPVAIAESYSYATTGIGLTINAVIQSNGTWEYSGIADLVVEFRFDFQSYPIIVSDSHGALSALFLNGFSRDIVPYGARSMDNGQTWSTPARIVGADQPAGAAAIPWLTVDDHDRVHAMWLDNRYGGFVPYTAWSSDAMTWSDPERIGDAVFVDDASSGRWIGDFVALVARGGTRNAVWSDSRTGSSRVYFASAPEPQ